MHDLPTREPNQRMTDDKGTDDSPKSQSGWFPILVIPEYQADRTKPVTNALEFWINHSKPGAIRVQATDLIGHTGQATVELDIEQLRTLAREINRWGFA